MRLKQLCAEIRLVGVLAATLCFAAMARAQAPASIFELNGDSANDNLTCVYGPCDYWNLLNGTGGNGPLGTGSSAGHSSVRTFVNGTTNMDNFQGGGSKDPNPISQWGYSSTSTPNKDTLDAGYAAAYLEGDFDIIFGADRLSPNGDANIGIWFFQNQVSLNGTGGFNGSHANGDVFIISSFTNGGGASTISAYTWNQVGLPNAINGGCASGVKNPKPGQCADANLLLLADPTTVCGSSGACAITNSKTVTASWATYAGGSLASPLFFEGGLDITQAFAAVGGTAPCFASFLEETRSSQSTSAVLKDFLLGGFPVCALSLTKTCGTASVNPDGTAFIYPVGGVVTNTGVGTLFNVQVIDTVNGVARAPINVANNTANSPNNGTSTLAAGETGTWSDSVTSSASSESDSAIAQAAVGLNGTPSVFSSTASAQCSASANTVLTITKTCSTSLQALNSNVTVSVAYGGQVCNTGSILVSGIALTDYPDSSNTGGAGTQVASGISLAPGACSNYGPLTYNPTLIDQTITGTDGIAGDGPGRYFFSNLITISSATPAIGAISKVQSSDPRTNGSYGFANASCPICQGSGECTAQ